VQKENRGIKAHMVAIALLLFTLSFTGLAFAQGSPWIQGTPKFLAIPGGNPAQAMTESVNGANVPLFTNHFSAFSQTWNYTMVGTDPDQVRVRRRAGGVA